MSDKKLKSIDIVFENCEVAKIDAKDIKYFSIEGITYSLHTFNCTPIITTSYSCKYLGMCLKNFDTLTYEYFEKERSLFKRISKYKDITHIDINYEDGTNLYVSTPWESNSQFFNPWLDVKIDNYENSYEEDNINGIVHSGYIKISSKWNINSIIKYVHYKIRCLKYRIIDLLNKIISPTKYIHKY